MLTVVAIIGVGIAIAGVGIAIAGVGIAIAGIGITIAGVGIIIAGIGDGLLHCRFELGVCNTLPTLFRPGYY